MLFVIEKRCYQLAMLTVQTELLEIDISLLKFVCIYSFTLNMMIVAFIKLFMILLLNNYKKTSILNVKHFN